MSVRRFCVVLGALALACTAEADAEPSGHNGRCPAHDECGGQPLDCEIFGCGEIESAVDRAGCIRPECTNDADCDAGFVCYAPDEFGGCVTSDLDCNGNQDDDCGGRYCVANDAFVNVAQPGLTQGAVIGSCSAEGIQMLTLDFGDVDCSTGPMGPEGPRLILRVIQATGAIGSFPVETGEGRRSFARNAATSEPVAIESGSVVLTEWDTDHVRGSYEVRLKNEHIHMASFEASMCGSDSKCPD